ncbi:DUF4349 domain-containing protein [Pueribacillus theae]|uniref:DUF4349 domain-containing protein n=2 Tax=Pueribacillus theae TaxID=2171751 RepID=A0A2U1K3T2_9BACI|nr:DUF4349 domain-containing protein [Pueribacillus theae]
MKNSLRITAFFFLLIMFTACSNSSEKSAEDHAGLMRNEIHSVEVDEDRAEIAQTEESKEATDVPMKGKRKIIYTAHMDIVVPDYNESEKKISEIVEKEKGYIVNSHVNQGEHNEKSGSITVRIPQGSFQSFLDSVEKISTEVTDQSVDGEDVTEEYVDLEARLKAKMSVKKRLETFMEQAETTKDLLAVSEQMGKVQEEIEQIEGRLNYLKNQSDYSTVTVSITEKSIKVGELGSKDLNTWTRSKQLFVTTIHFIFTGVSGAVVFLLGLSPILVPIAIIVVGLYLYIRRKKRNEKASRD